MIKVKNYDIVLMDIEMPKMNGYQAAEVMRKELKLNIPIIAITAHAMSGEKEKCLNSGMNDYISKPVNAELLFEKMINLISNKDTFIKPIVKGIEKEEKTEKVIDLKFLIETFKGKKNLILEIINVFLKQTTEDLSKLNEAVIKSDYMRIKAISHGMRSSYSMMGAAEVSIY